MPGIPLAFGAVEGADHRRLPRVIWIGMEVRFSSNDGATEVDGEMGGDSRSSSSVGRAMCELPRILHSIR